MLASRHKSAINRLIHPIALLLGRTGISPSALTLSGAVLTAAVCLWFIRTRRVVPFTIAVTLTGFFDGLDGPVARATGRVTKFGAYLDAVCDRYVESITVLSVAVVTGYWVLSAIVLAGSLLVSYTKARAAMEVPVTNLEWPDLTERTERDILFLIGLAASDIVTWRPFGRDLFWWTLVLLAVLVHLTVLQRMLRARRLIRSRTS